MNKHTFSFFVVLIGLLSMASIASAADFHDPNPVLTITNLQTDQSDYSGGEVQGSLVLQGVTEAIVPDIRALVEISKETPTGIEAAARFVSDPIVFVGEEEKTVNFSVLPMYNGDGQYIVTAKAIATNGDVLAQEQTRIVVQGVPKLLDMQNPQFVVGDTVLRAETGAIYVGATPVTTTFRTTVYSTENQEVIPHIVYLDTATSVVGEQTFSPISLKKGTLQKVSFDFVSPRLPAGIYATEIHFENTSGIQVSKTVSGTMIVKGVKLSIGKVAYALREDTQGKAVDVSVDYTSFNMPTSGDPAKVSLNIALYTKKGKLIKEINYPVSNYHGSIDIGLYYDSTKDGVDLRISQVGMQNTVLKSYEVIPQPISIWAIVGYVLLVLLALTLAIWGYRKKTTKPFITAGLFLLVLGTPLVSKAWTTYAVYDSPGSISFSSPSATTFSQGQTVNISGTIYPHSAASKLDYTVGVYLLDSKHNIITSFPSAYIGAVAFSGFIPVSYSRNIVIPSDLGAGSYYLEVTLHTFSSLDFAPSYSGDIYYTHAFSVPAPAAPSYVVNYATYPTNNPSSSTIYAGDPVTVFWSTSNISSCLVKGGNVNSKALAGNIQDYPTYSTKYTIDCYDLGGNWVFTRETPITVLPKPASSVKIYADKTNIASGTNVTISWATSGVISCSLYNNAGLQIANIASKGSNTFTQYNTDTYYISCTSVYGGMSDAVTVNVLSPSVMLSASSNNVTPSNNSVTLSWFGYNVKTCSLSGSVHGLLKTSSAIDSLTYSVTQTETFTVNCSGDYGNASASQTVYYSNPAPGEPYMVPGVELDTACQYQPEYFYFTAEDPNNRNIMFYFDWTGDYIADGSEGYVASRSEIAYPLQWNTLGAKEFHVAVCNDAGACSAWKAFTVTVNDCFPAPSDPEISGPTLLHVNEVGTFEITSIDPDGYYIWYSIDLNGDGSGDDMIDGPSGDPALYYKSWDTPGTYTFRVAAWNWAKSSNWVSYTVTVVNDTPTAPVISGPSDTCAAQSTEYSFSAIDPEGSNLKYGIDKDNNGVQDSVTGWSASGITQTQSFTWAIPGVYSFRINAQDGVNTSDWTSKTVTVKDCSASVALTTDKTSVGTGDPIHLNWSGTHITACTLSGSVQGDITSGGAVGSAIVTITQSETFTIDCSGSYGSVSDSKTVMFADFNENIPPSDPVVSGPTSGVCVGENVDYTFVSSDPEGDAIQYGIDLGDDGSQDITTNKVPSGVPQYQTLSWSTAGTKKFSVAAWDGTGMSGWSSYTVGVIDCTEPPIIDDGGGTGDGTVITVDVVCIPYQNTVSAPAIVPINSVINWRATANPAGTYQYSWNGTNLVSTGGDSIWVTYSSVGTKTAHVDVKDVSGKVIGTCNNSIVVSTNPTFSEF